MSSQGSSGAVVVRPGSAELCWRGSRGGKGVARGDGVVIGWRFTDVGREDWGSEFGFPAYVSGLQVVGAGGMGGPSGRAGLRGVRVRYANAGRTSPRVGRSSTGDSQRQAGGPEGGQVGGQEGGGRASVVRIDGLAGCSLYGTGEQAGRLLRNGTRVVLWNNDHFDYTAKSKNLYQSHPFVLAVRPDGSAVGVLIETTYRCELTLGGVAGVRAVVQGPAPAVVLIARGSAQEVVRALHELTGRIPMPPRWALGYHQCRWSYEPRERFVELAQEFRERGIPCDCLWFDIDYMDGFRCFTVDSQKFPDVVTLNSQLHALGFRTIYMIDCGIKVDTGYSVYADGAVKKHYITTATGAEYHGEVWPGACAFPDFTNAATRAWWAGLYQGFMAMGIDGVWNDMNEPAVFKGIEKTMPRSNLHRPDAELAGGAGADRTHARFHNLYGMLMTRATREGISQANPQRRPFVLTRSNFLGGQRYAATWTGDNRSDWNHLAWSISMALNLTLSGQPFVGPDIGGFIGNADGALFARWMGIGAMLPFARAHSEKTTLPHEPWSFGEACERTCRVALLRRYRLMPYLYTLFWRAAMDGRPVVAPVFFADAGNRALRNVDDAFLLGPDLLVQCGVTPTAKASAIPLLAGWKRVMLLEGTGEEQAEAADTDLPNLFLRPGALLPLGPVKMYTGEVVKDERLEVLMHQDEAGNASCEVYQDAGDGYGYERGEWALTRVDIDRTLKLNLRLEGDARYGAAVKEVR